MTTAWPAAPPGMRWTELDTLLARVEPIVSAETCGEGVHQVRWDPERTARVAYDAADGVVVLEAGREHTTRHRLVDDAALPGLRELLDPASTGQRFQQLLGTRVERCTAAVVSYRPGSRCVLRCAVDGGRGPTTYYVKVLASGTATVAESHEVLSRALGPLVPRLVGRWPELGALVTEAAPGRSASAVLADPTTDPRTRTTLVQALGSLLARVHRTVPGPLAAARRHSADAELAELGGYLPAAWQADATTAVSLGWAVQTLAERPPPVGTPVLAHGSYRAGQVVVDRGSLVLLDLDSVGTAPPEHDLGNLMAYLDWQHLRDGPTGRDPLSVVALRGYRRGGGLVDRGALSWWHAAALTKIAGRRYRSLDTRHWAAVPSAVNAAAVLLDPAACPRPAREGYLRPGSGPELSDPVRMTGLLAGARPRGAEELPITDAQVLRVAPGRRVTVRYRTSTPTAPGGDLVAKVYAEPARATTTHDNLRLVHALEDGRLRVGSQRPVGVMAERGLVLAQAAPGRPLAELPDTVAAPVAARCGRWLRALHATGAGPRRTLDLEVEVRNLGVWAAATGRADDRVGAAAVALADALAATVHRLPGPHTSLIHKDLHLGHVVLGEDGWARLIDLDEARLGDPAFDVAHLCAYADLTGHPVSRAAFLGAYGELDGPHVPQRLAWFGAYTLLKITKQQARSRLTEAAAHEAVERLERGRTWLAA